MKNIILTFAILFSFSLSAQNFEAGFVGGLTMSQISGDGLGGFDKPGSRIGAYISYPIKRNVNFEVGMQYVQKGSREPSGDHGISNYSMNLNYLEIPATINYTFKNGLVIESGIGSGVLFSYSEVDAIGNLNGESPHTFGLDFICGLQYQILNHLKFNLRYENTILPIRKEDVTTSLEKNKDWYSSMVSFALMYQISR